MVFYPDIFLWAVMVSVSEAFGTDSFASGTVTAI